MGLLAKILSIYNFFVYMLLFYNLINDDSLESEQKAIQVLVFHIPFLLLCTIVWFI